MYDTCYGALPHSTPFDTAFNFKTLDKNIKKFIRIVHVFYADKKVEGNDAAL